MKELTHDKIQTEMLNTFEELEKLRAETTKINGENRFYLFIVGASVSLAMVAVVKLFL